MLISGAKCNKGTSYDVRIAISSDLQLSVARGPAGWIDIATDQRRDRIRCCALDLIGAQQHLLLTSLVHIYQLLTAILPPPLQQRPPSVGC